MARRIAAIACLAGLLRATSVVASGPAGLVPPVEAAYAFLLHAGAGCLAAAAVRGWGVRLDLMEGRRQAPAEVVPELPAVAAREPAPVATVAPKAEPRPWRDRILAAREAGDAPGVLDLRAEPPADADEAMLRDLDADLAKWLLGLIHRRLRSGPLQADLVTLAERGAEAFGHAREGASLRAALPTLRRGAGLCPRCAKPYRGVWEACAECLGRPEPPPPVIPGLVAVDEDEYEPRSPEGRWFVDPDDEPEGNGRLGG